MVFNIEPSEERHNSLKFALKVIKKTYVLSLFIIMLYFSIAPSIQIINICALIIITPFTGSAKLVSSVYISKTETQDIKLSVSHSQSTEAGTGKSLSLLTGWLCSQNSISFYYQVQNVEMWNST